MGIRVQVVFYSMYGHVFRMADAGAAGAREVATTQGRHVAQIASRLQAGAR